MPVNSNVHIHISFSITTQGLPIYLHWTDEYFDRCREGLRHLKLESHRSRKKLLPGDIASCMGSVEIAMYQVLARHGFHLKSWQKTEGVDMPYRYCIVNKHIRDNKYEVFLLTTFGGARSPSDLSMLAKSFGMPMGNTGWISDLKPLQTNPPIFSFGLLRKSFVFAIPFVASIQHNDTDKRLAVGGRVHLLRSDLQRLQTFSASKIPFLLSNYKIIFRNLFSHKQNSTSAVDSKDTGSDTFSPTLLEFEASLEDLSEGIQEWEVRTKPPMRPVAPQRLPSRLRLDLRWLSRYATSDIITASTFLRSTLPRQPVRKTLPPPYYSGCLRARLNSLFRYFR